MSKNSCSTCGSSALSVHEDDQSIRYRPTDEMLPYKSHFTRCANCGAEYYTKTQGREASRAAAGALRRKAGLLAPSDIKAIRAKYELSQAQLERVLSLSAKSVARWESGTVCQSRAADRLLCELRDSPSLFQKLAVRAGVQVAAPVPVPNYAAMLEAIAAQFVTSQQAFASTNFVYSSRAGPIDGAQMALPLSGLTGTAVAVGAQPNQDTGSVGPDLTSRRRNNELWIQRSSRAFASWKCSLSMRSSNTAPIICPCRQPRRLNWRPNYR